MATLWMGTLREERLAGHMTKRRILFVDDEPNVLEGLRNLLRKQRQEWNMVFASSGKAALEELANEPVDVIVSDLRMPAMDGVELLTRVKDAYPKTARIILSGHAERDMISRVLTVAHQFISKPSDANVVHSVIERTCAFQTLMQDDGLRRVVGSLDRLPSLPEIYWQLTRAIENPNTGVADVAKIVEQDPALCVSVLHLVNSAYYGLARKTESIPKAVAYLGLENLKGLLVAAHVFGADDAATSTGLSPSTLREEAVLTARLARQIVRNPKHADAAFAAGIVHDVGQLVLAHDPLKRYGAVLAATRDTDGKLSALEKESLGTTHALVGAYLLGVWGLPCELAETVAFHHNPSDMHEGNMDILGAVHLADALVEAVASKRDPITHGNLDLPFLERVGLMAEFPKWIAKAEANASAAAARD